MIRPVTGAMRGADFDNRHQAIETARLAAIAANKQKVVEKKMTLTNRSLEIQAARAIVALVPVAAVQVRNLDVAAAAWRMHETLLADVDADV